MDSKPILHEGAFELLWSSGRLYICNCVVNMSMSVPGKELASHVVATPITGPVYKQELVE